MSKFCPRCGTEVVDEANFCMKCGFDFGTLKSPVSGAAPTAAPAAAPGPAPAPAVTAPVQIKPQGQGRPWIQNSGVVNPNPVAGYEVYNPTFHCRCEYCYYEFDYHTYDLGHRAWYPHGFVYCPRCQKPLRHKLEYEVINGIPANQYAKIQSQQLVPPANPV